MRSWIRRPIGAVLVAAAIAVTAAGGIVIAQPPVAPTPTPTATATVTATATPGACLASADCFPKNARSGPGATGIPAGTTLTSCGSNVTISTANTVIDSCNYTGSLTINAANVTIRKSRIAVDLTFNSTGGLIEDSEIGPNSGCNSSVALIKWAGYTVRRSYLHGNGDGLRFAGNDITAEDNLITTCDLPGDHSDGIQGNTSGLRNTVRHNTIDIRGSTNGPNAPVFFADGSKSATIVDNLLLNSVAGVFALKVNDDNSPDVGPWIVTGNRLVPGNVVTTNTECNASTMTWSDNRVVTVDGSYGITSTGGLVPCS